MAIVMGKTLRWGDREYDEFHKIFRAVVTEVLVDMYPNENGALTLVFENGTKLIVGSACVMSAKISSQQGEKLPVAERTKRNTGQRTGNRVVT